MTVNTGMKVFGQHIVEEEEPGDPEGEEWKTNLVFVCNREDCPKAVCFNLVKISHN